MTYPRLYLDIETYRSREAFENEKIIACGFLVDNTLRESDNLNYDPKFKYFYAKKLSEEKKILKQILDFVCELRTNSNVEIVGFNILRFDIPLIIGRSAKLRIMDVERVSSIFYNCYCIDYSQILLPANEMRFKGLKLSTIISEAKSMNPRIPPPEGHADGSKIKELFDQGRYEEIKEHCKADLDATRWLDLYGAEELLKRRYVENKGRKVYYSHPVPSYGTKQEKDNVGSTGGKFARVQIINEADTKPQDSSNFADEMEFFFKQIDECDAVGYRRYGNVITSGIGKEINCAFCKGKTVFEITDKGFKKVTKRVDYVSRELTRELYLKEVEKLR
jgi:hypothetical protein